MEEFRSWDRSRCGTGEARFPWVRPSRLRFSPYSSSARRLPGRAYFVRTGDQATKRSSVGLRVRFRCPLPSVFMT